MKKLACLLCSCCMAALLSAQQTTLTIDGSKPTAEIQPTMWGIFFEDINFSADGGLYAELVKNRSFEFAKPLMGWKEEKQAGGNGRLLVVNRSPENENNPRVLQVKAEAATGWYGLSNEGFRGMGIHANKQYNFSVWIKTEGNTNLTLKAELLNNTGKPIGSATIGGFTGTWKKYTIALTSTDSASKGRLNVLFQGTGTVQADMISLFPHDTWKNRPNGFRADLVQLLADIKPGFIRFPGGCIVEGMDLNNRYQWKKTVGNVEDRKLIMNRWNVEFPRRNAPDYFQSYGLGFYEYFLLCEDLGAAALPILNCGMACQFNSAEVADVHELDNYIQDALDLIEFANGAVTTKYGKLRADMGHPAPFNLTFIGVGNEQWDEQYFERYAPFEKVLREKHPEIKIVSGTGPNPDDKRFSYAWEQLKKLHPALVDEHYYKEPNWFLQNAERYDNYDRNGPKVFAGEYAAHPKEVSNPEGRNNWESALAEAAFMTGLERNADVVQMASYAPLLAHVDAWQWRPDLIWFDNLRSVGTPNYHVQKMYGNNKGTHVVGITSNGQKVSGKDSLYATAAIDQTTNELIIKVVNTSATAKSIVLDVKQISLLKKAAACTTLTGANTALFNTLDNPAAIVPVNTVINIKNNMISRVLEPASFTIIRAAYKK